MSNRGVAAMTRTHQFLVNMGLVVIISMAPLLPIVISIIKECLQ